MSRPIIAILRGVKPDEVNSIAQALVDAKSRISIYIDGHELINKGQIIHSVHVKLTRH